jgi:hypothetical protein
VWVPMAHAGHWLPALVFSAIPVLALAAYMIISGSVDRRREGKSAETGGSQPHGSHPEAVVGGIDVQTPMRTSAGSETAD